MQFSFEVQIPSFILRQNLRTTYKLTLHFYSISIKFNTKLHIPTTAQKQQTEDESGEFFFFKGSLALTSVA